MMTHGGVVEMAQQEHGRVISERWVQVQERGRVRGGAEGCRDAAADQWPPLFCRELLQHSRCEDSQIVTLTR